MRPKTLDHVALFVADRNRVADACTSRLAMHVIERTDRFTLLGSDARHGKLTLFDAEGPRERGVLKRIGLRVSRGGGETIDLGEGIEIVLVEAPTDVEYDLDHVALALPDPDGAAEEFRRYGFAPVAGDGVRRLEVGGVFMELHPGEPATSDRPLLNHIGLLVDSAEEHLAEARRLGLEVDDVVDAPNTYAIFLRGPERVRIEYVEHKPTFSLA